MRLKVRIPLYMATWSFLLGIGTTQAAPVTLTVDSSASALAGVPLAGTVVGNFDSAAQSLTFAGGSDIFLTADLAATGVIPISQIVNGGGTTVTATGSFQTSLSNLHLDLTAGTALNGGDASAVTFASSATGTVSGVLDVDFTVLGQSGSTVINFSGALTPSAVGVGTIGLSDTAGLTLSLPFEVALIVGDLDLSGGALLGDLLGPVESLLDASLAFQITQVGRLSGLVVARGDSAAVVPEPGTAALVLSAILLLGFSGGTTRAIHAKKPRLG